MFKSIKEALSLAERNLQNTYRVQTAPRKTLIDLRDLRNKLQHLSSTSLTESPKRQIKFLSCFSARQGKRITQATLKQNV